MSVNVINLSEGAGLTSRFRTEKENILATPYKNSGKLPICESFSKSAFDALFAVSGVTGVRVYSAMDSNLNVRFVICGVNSSNQDVYLPADPQSESTETRVIEAGVRCPDNCPPSSALNS